MNKSSSPFATSILAVSLVLLTSAPAAVSATGGSLYQIQNLFYNTPTEIVSGLAYGTITQLVSREQQQDCFTRMFDFGDKFSDIARMNTKVRGPMDNFVTFPMKAAFIILSAYEAVTTCWELDVNLQSYFLGQDVPVYDFSFGLKTFQTVLGMVMQMMSLTGHFDWFFFGKVVTNYLITIGVVSYNLVYYYA